MLEKINTPFALLFLALIVTICVIDAFLGETAEYFNAWVIVLKLTGWIHGMEPPTDRYLFAQDQLGPLSLPVASLVLFGGAGLVAWVVTAIGHLALR